MFISSLKCSCNASQRLRELAPQGIDLFFDNVGGSILDAALLNLANNGRVVVCGGISAYNSSGGAEVFFLFVRCL